MNLFKKGLSFIKMSAAFQPSAALSRAIHNNSAPVSGGVLLLIMFQVCWVMFGILFTKMAERDGGQTAFSKKTLYWAFGLSLVGAILFTAAQDLVDVKLLPALYKSMNDEFMTATLNTFESRRTSPQIGKIVSIFSNLHYNSVQLFVNVREYMIPAIVSAFIGMGIFFYINRTLGGIFTGAVIVFGLAYVGAIYMMQKPVLEQEECHMNRDQTTSDLLLNIHNIYAVNNTNRQIESFRNDLSMCQQKDEGYYNSAAGARAMLMIVLSVAFLIPLIYLLKLVRDPVKPIAFSMFASGVFVLAFIREYMFATVNHLGSMAWYSAYMLQVDRKVHELMYQDEILPRKVLRMTPPDDSTIRLSHVLVADLIALPDIVINPGDRLVMRGPIGSGKSTFLNVLFGKLPYTGSLTIGGVEVNDLDVTVLREFMLLIPQTVSLFQKTVFYNIAYGTDATREDVQALMDRYDITFTTLDYDVGRGGENLSGGQRQIILLLNAMLHKQKINIILMDEPTSALDANTRTKALQIIEDLIETRTAILVTHDPTLEALSTQTLHLRPL
jgi:ABC-type multidrug transport system fused ATPase/permease subunit